MLQQQQHLQSDPQLCFFDILSSVN